MSNLCGHQTETTDAPCRNPVAPGSTQCAAGHPVVQARALSSTGPVTPPASVDIEELVELGATAGLSLNERLAALGPYCEQGPDYMRTVAECVRDAQRTTDPAHRAYWTAQAERELASQIRLSVEAILAGRISLDGDRMQYAHNVAQLHPSHAAAIRQALDAARSGSEEAKPASVEGVFGEMISSYSRAQAIEDGVLVDVTETAKEAGFKWPVAMTRAAWEDLVAWDDSNRGIQDEQGRLWDVVWMASRAAKRGGDEPLVVEVFRVPNTPRATRPVLTKFVVHCGPGDTAEPVITLCLPGED